MRLCFPFIPTIIVTAAIICMIALGIWQIERAQWKKDLLARYEAASDMPAIAWPPKTQKSENIYFRKAEGVCRAITSWRPIAGRNQKGESGWSFIANCQTSDTAPAMQVDMGWSVQDIPPTGWRGGKVSGVIAPVGDRQLRLVAASPAPGLEASAPPSPESIPNNHIFYAIQWFFFATAAAVIYVIALRRRMKRRND